MQLAGVLMIIVGLFVKFTTFTYMIPNPIVGSVYIVTYGTLQFERIKAICNPHYV